IRDKYTQADARQIRDLICGKIVEGFRIKDFMAEFYSWIKEDVPAGYKTFILKIYLAVDEEKRIHEESIASVMGALYQAKHRGNFSDEAIQKVLHRISIIR
ncbi:hypothetical protein H7X65_01550, partial [Candidatus Parcubacteria bacterium]|nr:hypothetical protein [Candidatus Parcubacteria bacterium]